MCDAGPRRGRTVMAALLRLRRSGLALGEGDAFSAVRAGVLALGTHDPDGDWEELRRAAEAQAVLAAAELAAADRRTGTSR